MKYQFLFLRTLNRCSTEALIQICSSDMLTLELIWEAWALKGFFLPVEFVKVDSPLFLFSRCFFIVRLTFLSSAKETSIGLCSYGTFEESIDCLIDGERDLFGAIIEAPWAHAALLLTLTLFLGLTYTVLEELNYYLS